VSESQKGRVLTLVVEFTDDTYPQWIMDAHLKAPQHGVKVKSIKEGTVQDNISDVVEELQSEFDLSDSQAAGASEILRDNL
jgi:hypothetical protein